MTSTTRVSKDKCPRSIQTRSISFIFNKNFSRLPCRTTKDKRSHIFEKVVIVLGKAKTDFGFKSSFVSFSQQKKKKKDSEHARKGREKLIVGYFTQKAVLNFHPLFLLTFAGAYDKFERTISLDCRNNNQFLKFLMTSQETFTTVVSSLA